MYNNLQSVLPHWGGGGGGNLENEQFSCRGIQGISLSVRAIKALKLLRSRPCALSETF